MVAAYLIDPARRGYPLDELAERRGHRRRGRGRRRRRPSAVVIARVLAERQRARLEEDGLTRLLHEVELPLVDVLVEMERAGRQARRRARCAEIGERVGAQITELEREIWELAGEEFTIGSPQQLAEILFDKLGLTKKRRGKTGFSTDARVLQAIRDEHEIVAKIEEWRELSKLKSHLPRRVARADRPTTGRLHTTFNQTAATTGPPVEHRPEPPEHPDPHRARARDPRLLRGRGGQQADLGRLLAGRAAAAGPHRRRGGAEGDLPARRGRAHGHGGARSSAPRPSRSTRARARRRRWSTTGSSTACRPTAWPTGCRSRRRRRRSSSTATWTRFPKVKAFIDDDDRAGDGGGLRVDAVRPHPPDPGAARAPAPDALAGRAAGREHGDPGHRRGHHQGRDGALPATRCATPACDARWCCRSTTSCCSRRRTTRSSAATRDRRARDGARRSSWTRRSRWTSASAPTGWRRSSGRKETVVAAGHRRRRRADRAAGADQLDARQVASGPSRRPRRSRSSSGPSLLVADHAARSAAASATWARRATCPGTT